MVTVCTARSEPGGTRWRMGGEVKGKQANGVGSQYNSTLPRNMVCPALLPLLLLIRTPRLPVVDWTDAPTDLNGLVHFGERWILVSARVPSRSARAIPPSVTLNYTFWPSAIFASCNVNNKQRLFPWFSAPAQTGPGAHPASYTTDTGSLLRG